MIPEITDSRWDNLILNEDRYQFHLLSLKILMSRIYRKVKQDCSASTIEQCKREVYDYFLKNEKISQKDIVQIFEGDGL